MILLLKITSYKNMQYGKMFIKMYIKDVYKVKKQVTE